MELFRSLVITNISAEDLQNVRRIFRMEVYALASISGDPYIPAHKWKATDVDSQGLTNPTWGTDFRFIIHDPSLHGNLQSLNFQFHCKRSFGDRFVGELSIPVKGLFDKAGNRNVSSSVSYPVKRPSGRVQGEVKFTFKFGKPLRRVAKPRRSQAPPGPAVPVQSMEGAEPKLNSSGDCQQQEYTAESHDDDDDDDVNDDDDGLASDYGDDDFDFDCDF